MFNSEGFSIAFNLKGQRERERERETPLSQKGGGEKKEHQLISFVRKEKIKILTVAENEGREFYFPLIIIIV